MLPVFGHISTILEVSQEGFADWDVVGSRIVVQLLVPLLIEVPRALRDVMSVHDVEDFVSNTLAISCALTHHAYNLAK